MNGMKSLLVDSGVKKKSTNKMYVSKNTKLSSRWTLGVSELDRPSSIHNTTLTMSSLTELVYIESQIPF